MLCGCRRRGRLGSYVALGLWSAPRPLLLLEATGAVYSCQLPYPASEPPGRMLCRSDQDVLDATGRPVFDEAVVATSYAARRYVQPEPTLEAWDSCTS